MNTELLEEFKELCSKEISLSEVCRTLKLNSFQVLSLVNELRNNGINIVTKMFDDDIYMFNNGEREVTEEYSYNLKTDNNNEFKFIAISDTYFGSKYQQLSILNDICAKGISMGYNNIFHCGNISAGIYPITNIYADTYFLDDSLRQIDYITKYYPEIEGMKTYFITGARDERHLKANKINIGKRISDIRQDMIYLGSNSCIINIDKTKVLLFNSKLNKTYTVSYRPQQQVDSFRSEDKPNIMLYGGLLQMEKFKYREVDCISVPSVCATTKEMLDRRYSNTIGAWYITIRTDNKGYLESVKAMESVYYVTNKDDYKKPKILKLTKEEK